MSALHLCRESGAQGREGVFVCCGNIKLHCAAQVACATLHTAPETSPEAHLLSAFSISIAKLLLLPLPLLPLPHTRALLITVKYIYFPFDFSFHQFVVAPLRSIDLQQVACLMFALHGQLVCGCRLLSWLSELICCEETNIRC